MLLAKRPDFSPFHMVSSTLTTDLPNDYSHALSMSISILKYQTMFTNKHVLNLQNEAFPLQIHPFSCR